MKPNNPRKQKNREYKKDKRTYNEGNRIVAYPGPRKEGSLAAYPNYRYATLVKSFAYDKDMSVSDAVLSMIRFFFEKMDEAYLDRIKKNYLDDLKEMSEGGNDFERI